MRLAKDRLDIGLLTDDRAMLAFMHDGVGLGPPEHLPIGEGVDQYRFDADGSVIKVNVVAGLPVERRSGYKEVLIADRSLAQPRTFTGPDGVVVSRVPSGHLGIDQLGVRIAVPELEAARRYFGDALGWQAGRRSVLVGATTLLLDETPTAPSAVEMPVRGWTYLTVQVHDCDAETRAAVRRGATLVKPPGNLRDVARFSMVADAWGNQLEISQRASLTGPLPPA